MTDTGRNRRMHQGAFRACVLASFRHVLPLLVFLFSCRVLCPRLVWLSHVVSISVPFFLPPVWVCRSLCAPVRVLYCRCCLMIVQVGQALSLCDAAASPRLLCRRLWSPPSLMVKQRLYVCDTAPPSPHPPPSVLSSHAAVHTSRTHRLSPLPPLPEPATRTKQEANGTS